jgi:hypothetical protein
MLLMKEVPLISARPSRPWTCSGEIPSLPSKVRTGKVRPP